MNNGNFQTPTAVTRCAAALMMEQWEAGSFSLLAEAVFSAASFCGQKVRRSTQKQLAAPVAGVTAQLQLQTSGFSLTHLMKERSHLLKPAALESRSA